MTQRKTDIINLNSIKYCFSVESAKNLEQDQMVEFSRKSLEKKGTQVEVLVDKNILYILNIYLFEINSKQANRKI